MKSNNKKFVKIIGIMIAVIFVLVIVFTLLIIYLDNRLKKLSNQPLGYNNIIYQNIINTKSR